MKAKEMNNHSSNYLYHSNLGGHSNGLIEIAPSSGSYKSSRRAELKRKIVEFHLSYLNRDDNPEKLNHKTKLEGLIIEYLSIVPHSEKFEILEIAECLDRSIIENNAFSASKAATAFEILEKYANNLLTKPWRKEFQTIYPYGGYIKGLIEKQLRGSINILYLMGYRNRTVNGVTTLYNGSRVNDPDLLARISLECLIAFVECQMMSQIADTLKSKGIDINWLQMLEIKSDNVCSMSELINYVVESNSSKNLIDFDKSVNSNQHHNKRCLHFNGCSPQETPSLSKRSEKPFSDDIFIHSKPDGHFSYDLMQFPDSLAFYNQPYQSNVSFIAPPPMFATNHSSYSSPAPPPPPSPSPPPPTILTSLSSSNRPISSSHNCKNATSPCSSSSSSTSSISSYQTTDRKVDKANSNSNKSSLDTVDVNLSLLSLKSHSPKIKAQNGSLERSVGLVPKKVEHRLLYSTSNSNNPSTNKMSNLKSSISEPFNRKNNNNNNINISERNSSSGESKRSKPIITADSLAAYLSSTCSSRDDIDSKEKSNKESDNRTWSCAYCTFLNDDSSDICEMCSRSKEKPGNDITPLVSGGKVCPLCTLVNDKEAHTCSACESSLLNSPTYI
jgi:protein tamozhennic